MTIEGLADAAGMHKTHLSKIERGHGNPSWDKLMALANTLQVPLSSIVLDAEADAKRANAPQSSAPEQAES